MFPKAGTRRHHPLPDLPGRTGATRWPRSRTGGLRTPAFFCFVPHRVPGRRVGSEPGRPLTDALLTALVQQVGPLEDGPLKGIFRQTITQQLAQDLWDAAALEVFGGKDREAAGRLVRQNQLGHVRRILTETLPVLLPIEHRDFAAMQQMLGGWQGTLHELAKLAPWRSPPLDTVAPTLPKEKSVALASREGMLFDVTPIVH